MTVLDLDLDFFLTDCCPLANKGERPSKDCAEPWTEQAVESYLVEHLGLDAAHPIPGVITDTHDKALSFWRFCLGNGILQKPFSVVHVDAHSDLGIGKPGPGFVLNNVLGIPPDKRDRFERYYDQKQLDEANYLLFALAFRWIDALTLVRDPFSRADFPSFIRKGEEEYQPIRLSSFVSELFEKEYGKEPETKLRVFHDPFDFYAKESFACINLACSPRYAPKEADRLIPIISKYMHLVSGLQT